MPSKYISNCETCGREFKHQTYYKRHIVKCSKQSKKKHVCDICSKEFPTGGALGGHKGTSHSKNGINTKREFDCPICNIKFYGNKGGFINHVKSHDEKFVKSKGEKISKAKKEFYQDEEKSKLARELMSNKMKIDNPMYNKSTVDKMVSSRKKYFSNLSNEQYSQLVMNFINAPKKGNAVKHSEKYTPTKIEQMIIDLKIPGLIYNGNSKKSKTIRFKNKNYKHSVTPDFIYEYDDKKFIEVFGVYWHPKSDEELYVKSYIENNYNVLIIWEDDLYNNIEKEKNRIIKFLLGGD